MEGRNVDYEKSIVQIGFNKENVSNIAMGRYPQYNYNTTLMGLTSNDVLNVII